jgi:hypothetical protein
MHRRKKKDDLIESSMLTDLNRPILENNDTTKKHGERKSK